MIIAIQRTTTATAIDAIVGSSAKKLILTRAACRKLPNHAAFCVQRTNCDLTGVEFLEEVLATGINNAALVVDLTSSASICETRRNVGTIANSIDTTGTSQRGHHNLYKQVTNDRCALIQELIFPETPSRIRFYCSLFHSFVFGFKCCVTNFPVKAKTFTERLSKSIATPYQLGFGCCGGNTRAPQSTTRLLNRLTTKVNCCFQCRMHHEFEPPVAPTNYQPPTSAEELLLRYRSGERYFQDAVLGGAELSDANLSNINLEDADLEDAQLNGANLDGAWLRSANLEDANLAGASLVNANLRGSYFHGATFEGANLKDAALPSGNGRGACFRNATLVECNLRFINLIAADLEGADLSNSWLDNSRFTRANLTRATLKGVNLDSVDLVGANMDGIIS